MSKIALLLLSFASSCAAARELSFFGLGFRPSLEASYNEARQQVIKVRG